MVKPIPEAGSTPFPMRTSPFIQLLFMPYLPGAYSPYLRHIEKGSPLFQDALGHTDININYFQAALQLQIP